MQDRVLIGLTGLWCVTALISLVVHVAVVCPRLYKNGAQFPTGLLPWRLLREMHWSRDICRMNSDSLSPYYIYMLLLWFNVGFGCFVGLLHLWKSTNPPA
mgnify:CR=1 FL=1